MHRTLLTIGIISVLSLTLSSAHSEEQDTGSARKLVNAQGCKACHTLEGDGGIAAGSFENMRAHLSRNEIRQRLVNPVKKHATGRMPDFSHLSKAEIDHLVNFIQPEP